MQKTQNLFLCLVLSKFSYLGWYWPKRHISSQKMQSFIKIVNLFKRNSFIYFSVFFLKSFFINEFLLSECYCYNFISTYSNCSIVKPCLWKYFYYNLRCSFIGSVFLDMCPDVLMLFPLDTLFHQLEKNILPFYNFIVLNLTCDKCKIQL